MPRRSSLQPKPLPIKMPDHVQPLNPPGAFNMLSDADYEGARYRFARAGLLSWRTVLWSAFWFAVAVGALVWWIA